MPRVRPLSGPGAARGTLAQRLTLRMDRVRQLATKFGARSRRVYLVWLEASGETSGAGYESVRARRELLPTPRVQDATTVTRRPLSIGVVPDGSIRIDQISSGWYTEDHLRGIRIPAEYDGCGTRPAQSDPVSGTTDRPLVRDPLVFFYEIVEDGRGDDPSARRRYKLAASPWRNETGAQWAVMLEPMSSDLDRSGTPQLGVLDVED